jgi:hypothetical protein
MIPDEFLNAISQGHIVNVCVSDIAPSSSADYTFQARFPRVPCEGEGIELDGRKLRVERVVFHVVKSPDLKKGDHMAVANVICRPISSPPLK